MIPKLSELEAPLKAEVIQSILPHRYPFALLDCVTYLSSLVMKGYKNVSQNEPFFQGHFPGKPIMPGVLILEALAQLGCIHKLLTDEDPNGKLILFAGMEKVRFKAPVYPGDRLELQTEHLWLKGALGKCKAEARVDNKLVTEAELIFAIVPKDKV